LPEWVEVSTQQALDAALEQSNVIPICNGEGSFVVDGEATIRAADSATVRAAGAATIEAGGSASVHASGSSTVIVWDQATVEAVESAGVLAADDAQVEASGSAAVRALRRAKVVAREDATVEAEHFSTVTASDSVGVMAWESATVEASGAAIVLAWDRAKVEASERAQVRAWGRATVAALGSAAVEAWDRTTVAAGDSVSVRAWCAATVTVRDSATVEASEYVSVIREGDGANVTGGVVDGTGEVAPIASAEQWCRFHGVEVENGIVTLYKSVDSDYTSRHGMSYAPGSLPRAADWDDGERTCGGGLHFSPRPYLGLEFTHKPRRYVACPVRLEDIAVGPGPHQNKVRAKEVCAPVYEVDDNGRPVA
jgi:hypothetical protein